MNVPLKNILLFQLEPIALDFAKVFEAKKNAFGLIPAALKDKENFLADKDLYVMAFLKYLREAKQASKDVLKGKYDLVTNSDTLIRAKKYFAGFPEYS